MKTELVEFLQGFARDGKVCASDQPLLVPSTVCLGVRWCHGEMWRNSLRACRPGNDGGWILGTVSHQPTATSDPIT